MDPAASLARARVDYPDRHGAAGLRGLPEAQVEQLASRARPGRPPR